MATVKKGTLTPAPQWRKHLRNWKRVYWHRERKAGRRTALSDAADHQEDASDLGHEREEDEAQQREIIFGWGQGPSGHPYEYFHRRLGLWVRRHFN